MVDLSPHREALPLLPPSYCQYVRDACDQTFEAPTAPRVFFAYASSPEPIAATIKSAIEHLSESRPDVSWMSWEAMDPRGQVIFCRICSSMRSSAVLVADISTLNMNLMFEIGVAVGLGMPVIPIRDSSLSNDQRPFRELGLLDTVGYVSFTNSHDLAQALGKDPFPRPLPTVPTRHFHSQPIYLLQSPIRTDGSIALSSSLKKARIQFRAFDSVETPRLSLHEARRQVAGSLGVVADMISPRRGEKAIVHNARSALICGMALAQQKAVLMLAEEMDGASQPIDYRDVVRTYSNPSNVPAATREFVTDVVALMQADYANEGKAKPERLLTRIDLGDLAAENEIRALRHYFVETGQAVRARQGHARLVIGRKEPGRRRFFTMSASTFDGDMID